MKAVFKASLTLTLRAHVKMSCKMSNLEESMKCVCVCVCVGLCRIHKYVELKLFPQGLFRLALNSCQGNLSQWNLGKKQLISAAVNWYLVWLRTRTVNEHSVSIATSTPEFIKWCIWVLWKLTRWSKMFLGWVFTTVTRHQMFNVIPSPHDFPVFHHLSLSKIKQKCWK